jgi:molybdate transport repressor ModE-like protein
MQLEQIRVFIAVARTGSFSVAARELFISHSTTSRAVTALEDELGVRLIERDKNRMTGLTPAGRLLMSEGGRLLADADELEKKLRAAGRRQQ